MVLLSEYFYFFSKLHFWLLLGGVVTLEIIFNLDNVIFISLIISNLPKKKQDNFRYRSFLLTLLIQLTLAISINTLKHVNSVIGHFPFNFCMKNLVLLTSGLFILYKSHSEFLRRTEIIKYKNNKYSHNISIIETTLLNIALSFDSIITAISLLNHILLIVIATVTATTFTFFLSKKIIRIISSYQLLRTISLIFLMFIGLSLISEGFNSYIPKIYIYSIIIFFLIFRYFYLYFHKR